jgi:hypothetical protein
MVMPPPGSKQPKQQQHGEKPLFDPNLVKPSAVSSLSKPQRKGGGASWAAGGGASSDSRPPFRPCNPKEARLKITEERHGYVGLHSPYDIAHRIAVLERQEAQKRVLGGTFNPSSASQARKEIQVDYYLNSADAETIAAERRYIKDKANRNMVEYYRRMNQQLASQRVGNGS